MKLRHLMIESLSSSILLVVLAILFTICAGPANAASEPGTVTIVGKAEPASLDPGNTALSNESQVMLKNILETLTEINPADSSITPRLAHSWKQIDSHTWHFFLRKGVKFHDGEDFNAKAVVFNIQRLYDKRRESRTRDKFFSNFKMEGKALDSHTLEITTDRFEPLLPTLMGIFALCSPNTPLDKWTRNPIGTGPYKFVKWDSGIQMVLERFDGYWGGQPQVKKVVYIWRGESSVRAAMVAIGEADLAPSISLQDANRPDMDYSYLDSETSVLQIGAEEPPLNDRRVRLALNYAVDRNALRGSILSKDVVPATQLVGPTISGHNPDLKPWPYDPQKARNLLDEARKDGVPVDKEILLADRIVRYPGSNEVMEAVMAMYKAVGLNVKLKFFDPAAEKPYRYKPYIKVPFLCQNLHDNSKGDAVFSVYNFYHCNAAQTHSCDKKLDDLIGKAQVATGEERKNLWRVAFKRIHEDIVADVMLFHMVSYARVGKRINFKPTMATINEIQIAQLTFK